MTLLAVEGLYMRPKYWGTERSMPLISTRNAAMC